MNYLRVLSLEEILGLAALLSTSYRVAQNSGGASKTLVNRSFEGDIARKTSTNLQLIIIIIVEYNAQINWENYT